ncbi:MAG: hypothetical protein PHP43_10395 [Methanoculleus sp.]|nr:hypothetical protein [Methanoculleus sp.]
MKFIAISADVARAIEQKTGLDFEQVEREAREQREAAAIAAAEEKQRKAEAREQRRQAALWQAFADELGERVRVEINGKEIRTAGKVVCPHCGTVPADLLRLSCNAGDLLLHSERQGGPFQPVNYPDADRRWRTAPHIDVPVKCECGGDFDLTITVAP